MNPYTDQFAQMLHTRATILGNLALFAIILALLFRSLRDNRLITWSGGAIWLACYLAAIGLLLWGDVSL